MHSTTTLAAAAAALCIAGAGWAQTADNGAETGTDTSGMTPAASAVTADAASRMSCSEFLALDLNKQNEAVSHLVPASATGVEATEQGTTAPAGTISDDGADVAATAGSSTPIPGTDATGADMAATGPTGAGTAGTDGASTDTASGGAATATAPGTATGTSAGGAMTTGTDMASGNTTDGGTTGLDAPDMAQTGSDLAASDDSDPFGAGDAAMGEGTTPTIVSSVTEVCNADATASLSDALAEIDTDAMQPTGETATN